MQTPLSSGAFSLITWFALYLLLWWIIGDAQGWVFGIPSALLAAWLAMRLGLSLWSLRWWQLPGLVLFLLREMLLGAWDVARRVLSPRCRIAPAWTHYRFAVGDARVRYLTSLVVCLMPGSFAAEFDRDGLRVHILDKSMDWQPVVIETEQRLARLLGVEQGA